MYSNATPNERYYQRTKSIQKIINDDDSRNERLEWTSSHAPVQDEAVQAVLGMNQKHILPCPRFLVFSTSSLPQSFSYLPTYLVSFCTHSIAKARDRESLKWEGQRRRVEPGTKSRRAEMATRTKHLKQKGKSGRAKSKSQKWEGREGVWKGKLPPFFSFFLLFSCVFCFLCVQEEEDDSTIAMRRRLFMWRCCNDEGNTNYYHRLLLCVWEKKKQQQCVVFLCGIITTKKTTAIVVVTFFFVFKKKKRTTMCRRFLLWFCLN